MYWIVSLAALAALAFGWSLAFLAEGSRYLEFVFATHVALGIGVVALVIIVPIWRLFRPPADVPLARPHWLQLSLRVSEWLLFVLVLASAFTGYLEWSFKGDATPAWAQDLHGMIPIGQHAGELFSRWHAVSGVAVSASIVATLGLLAWGTLKGHAMPHLIPRHRRGLGDRKSPRELRSDPMQPAPEPEATTQADLIARGRRLARRLKFLGAIGFWGQLCLWLIAALLLVVTTSSSYYEDNLPSLSYGLSWADGLVWAYVALGVLALTVMGFYACMLLARSMKHGGFHRDLRNTAMWVIKGINVGNSLGMTMAMVGCGFSIALLISKTVSEPPGIAITDPQLIVRAVDVFVLLANFNIVVAHFLGMLIGLLLMHHIHHVDTAPDANGQKL